MKNKNKDLFNYAAVAINAISYIFNNNPPLINDSFDWNGFVKFCYSHKILNIVYYGLTKANIIIPENIKNIFEENRLHSMLKNAQRDAEIENISNDFENNEIKFMIMKGYVIKDIYPETYLRSMSDVDILVCDNIEKASDILIKNGFELKSKEFLHYTFNKTNSFAIELHKSLVDESLETLYNYFKTGFERAKQSQNLKYKYELSNEDFYIFLIAHIAKHYKNCGTGIRSVLDIYLFNRAYTALDRNYISNELNKIGLNKFENVIYNLSFQWFGREFDGSFDTVGEYLVSGGVYGNIDNHELNKFVLDKNQKGKFSYIIKTIFPNKEYMCARYKILNKIPVLIPAFWIIRIISTFFNKKESVRYRLKGVSEYNDKDDKRFKDVGLK